MANTEIMNTNTSRFADMLSRMHMAKLPDEAYKQVGTDSDGNAVQVVAPVFKFAQEKGKKTEIQVNNPDVALILYRMQAAHGAEDEIKKALCRELYKLSTYDGVIRQMNFDSAIDLYCAIFGQSRDKASKMLRIGKYFIDDNNAFIPVVPSSWTTSHLQELLQYMPEDEGKATETVARWLNDGIIADGMTCKAIRTAMKSVPALAAPDEDTGKRRKSKKADGDAAPAANSDADVSVIDRLDEMTTDAKVGHVLNAAMVIEQVFSTFDLDEQGKRDMSDCLEWIRTVARAQVK